MSSDARLPISVIIPTRNEEKNLPACLASVAWANEVFVVDSSSADRTAEIARAAGANVVDFHYVPGGPRKKNWALDNLPLRHEWVLLLDADERITPELAQEIGRLFAPGAPSCDGYYLNRKQVFLGTWLRHGGNYPSWNLRLLRRDAGRYERLGTEGLASAGDVEVHEHIVLTGKAGYLAEPMLHEDDKGLAEFIDRHNRYSTWDARMRGELARHGAVDSIPARWHGGPVERKRFLKKIWIHLPMRPLLRFLYMYVLRAGFLDGRAGWLYACFKAIQEFHISAKMYEEQWRAQARIEAAEPAVQPAGSRDGSGAGIGRPWGSRPGSWSAAASCSSSPGPM